MRPQPYRSAEDRKLRNSAGQKVLEMNTTNICHIVGCIV